MALFDSKNTVKIVESILPEAVTADNTGTAVAVAGFESVLASLTMTTASSAGTFKLTESDTSGGSYTDVAAADIIGTQDVACVEDSTVTLGYIGNKGFIKLVFTHSADGVICGNVALGKPHVAPVTGNG